MGTSGFGMINAVSYSAAGILYLALAGLVGVQARRSRTGWLLVLACLASAAWLIGSGFALPGPPGLVAGLLEMARSAAWYGFLLHIYRRAIGSHRGLTQGFAVMGIVAALTIVVGLLPIFYATASSGLWLSSSNALRIGIASCCLLLIENLYRNTPEEARWHINLPCIGLAGMFLYDIAIAADALLFHVPAASMITGRAISSALVVPLLALGAARNRNWDVRIHVSRTAVFHTASLIGSGLLLLGLTAVGELLRYLGGSWADLAEITMIFGGLIAIATILTSGSARSRLRRILVDHFFTYRYDYRREWERSIETLSATDAFVPLHNRVIRTVATVVDSPGGVLLLRGEAGFVWAGSWNMPAASHPLPAEHSVVRHLEGGESALRLDGAFKIPGLEGAWLAVGLSHAGRLIGIAVMAPPRADFPLDGEVYALLRIIGRQGAAYLAEQRATETLIEAQALHDFGKRFAFVAHDIKNVSSQLSMLLSNAELHLSNPEFQRDMLATVRASVQRISGLLRKLQSPESDGQKLTIEPAERIDAVIHGSPRLRAARIEVQAPARNCGLRMSASAFDAVVTHLLDNALDAVAESSAGGDVQVRVAREARHVVVDIVDHGSGMTEDFIRERLFRPFDTSKRGGSGIGAWQARELVREAGGDLQAISAPGHGTTMRIVLPASDGASAGIAWSVGV